MRKNGDFKSLLDYLKEKSGFDFSAYRPSMIERRIGQRLIATRCQDCPEYLNLLEVEPQEIDKLLEALTINVSSFFRDPLTFEFIENRILPIIVSEKKKRHDNSLRIWSSGCSCGEEPYSVAILVNELFEKENIQNAKRPHSQQLAAGNAGEYKQKPNSSYLEDSLQLAAGNLQFNINIFATDIDKNAIKRAKEAVYLFDSIKDIKYGFLKRYFTQEHDRYSLRPEIKEKAIFSFYDLLDKTNYVPPESIFGGFDLVLCRNVLIYLQTEAQNIVFEKLHRSLSNNGYLILGEAEAPTQKYRRHFKRVTEYCHIYQKINRSIMTIKGDEDEKSMGI